MSQEEPQYDHVIGDELRDIATKVDAEQDALARDTAAVPADLVTRVADVEQRVATLEQQFSTLVQNIEAVFGPQTDKNTVSEPNTPQQQTDTTVPPPPETEAPIAPTSTESSVPDVAGKDVTS